MSHNVLIQLVAILVLGISAQWLAWRLGLPSILLLLAAGILAGPITGWIDSNQLFGRLLLPMVSLSVAVILYEGGLNLKIHELYSIGHVFLSLTTVGVTVSWLVGALAAHFVLGFQWPVATLLGAILVVTGPTVIGPILRHLRLRGKVGALLKWEGIIIDPLGAVLAVLTFTVVQAGASQEGIGSAVLDMGKTLIVGTVAGGLAAGVLILALWRFWIPDSLHNPVSLMLMFVALTVANMIQGESGLLAVTIMGIVLANQKIVSVRHVVEFKETLTVLLISCLFVILAADLKLQDVRRLGWESVAFVVILIVVARPASVVLATWRSGLTWQEKCFLSFMAPRGIVAAAISSVFALSLASAGYGQAFDIVPVTFLVVFVTVLIYGLAAAPLALWLGLTQSNPQGILFIGADSWVRELALALRDEECSVFLIDTDWENICFSRMAGLPCLYGSALAEATREQIDYTGLGKMLAVTSNNEVNSLACLRYTEDFGRQEVYQLPFPPAKEGLHEVVLPEHQGRLLFGKELTFERMSNAIRHQAKVKKTKLTPQFDYSNFISEHGHGVLPLFVFRADGTLRVVTVSEITEPTSGDLIISVVDDMGSQSVAGERML